MRNIFKLTKREQRVVIVIVTVVVAAAFAKHAWQTRSSPPVKSSSPQTTSRAQHESPDHTGD